MMDLNMIRSYPFEFHWENKLRMQHASRALAYIKKEKTLKDFALEYGCSTASIKNSYFKVCRQVYWQINHKFRHLFDQDFIDKIYDKEMQCDEGIALFENFFLCMKRLEIDEPTKNILDIYEKEKTLEQVYHEKLDQVINRISNKRLKMIETINKDFDLLDKWLKDLK